MEKRVYQIKEIQEITGLSRNTIMPLIRSGELKAIKAGQRRWIVPAWAFEEFLKDNTYKNSVAANLI